MNVPLKEYIEKLIEAKYDTINHRFDALKQSTSLARDELRERLAGMNEFRDTLKDQASRFITRDQFDETKESYEKRFNELEKTDSYNLGSRATTALVTTTILSIISIILAIVAIYNH